MMNDSTTHPEDQAERLARREGTVRRAAQVLCGGSSTAVFLLTLSRFVLVDPVAVVLVMLLLLAALGLLIVGVLLLLWVHRGFFGRAWGVWLWAGVLLGALAFGREMPSDTAMTLALGEVVGAWGAAAAVALGPALAIYLLRTDRSLRVFALTLLLLMGLLYSVGDYFGWGELLNFLTYLDSGPMGTLLQTLMCFAIWVFFICPLIYVWYTCVLLDRDGRRLVDRADGGLSRMETS